MGVTTRRKEDRVASTNGAGAASVSPELRDPRLKAFALPRFERDALLRFERAALLRIAVTAAPIAFGLDRFFSVMVDGPTYLWQRSRTRFHL